MLNGIYGYIFGGEESNDSTSSTSSSIEGSDENEEPLMNQAGKMCEDDWFMINDDNANVDRYSPVLIARPEIRDIDELSFASSRKAPAAPNYDELRRAEELRLAKARNAQRAHLEKVMFEDMSLSTLAYGSFQKSTCSKSLKKTGTNGSEIAKGKSRSKKSSGKMSSGRNNDRKVNNID